MSDRDYRKPRRLQLLPLLLEALWLSACERVRRWRHLQPRARRWDL